MAVFHLKYRPQKIKELDLIDVAETLEKILSKEEEIPQSFLFTGPKGSGKTSAARIVARAVNCLKPEGVEPCGECVNCKEILGGNSIDIIEIDAASNRGIDDVRVLKEKSYLLPSKLKRKVFIVDEVHMLTKEAFNALLKLIEEPPKHTIFILCTTDFKKIPETILSRLIKVNFRKGTKKELMISLKKIIEGEKVDIDEKTMELIVEKSDGSFRNLQRTFNEIFLQFGKKINLENVKNFFESNSGDYSGEELESDLAGGVIKVILDKMEKLAEKGVDFSLLREKFLVFFQQKLLGCYGVGENNSKLNAVDLGRFLNLLIMAGKQEKEAVVEQLPIELAIIDFLGEKKNDDKKGIEIKEEEIKEEEKKEEEELVTIEGNIKLEELEGQWGNILIAVKPFNHSVEAFLRAARPKLIKGNIVVLEVFYPFHKERLEEIKNKKIVESSFRKIFKMDLSFECVLGKDKKEPLVIKNDTPMEKVNDQLAAAEDKEKDIYDVAKEIFG